LGGIPLQIHTTRFGLIEYSPQDLLHFPDGLLGFQDLTDYLLIPLEANPAFFWLQSVQEGQVAFLITDPFLFFTDYQVELSETLKQELAITKRDQVVLYAIVTIPASGVKDMTANLVGPLIINRENGRGAQHVLGGNQYHTKHRLFNKTDTVKAGG
jgi:flagellar assembly factor FliW